MRFFRPKAQLQENSCYILTHTAALSWLLLLSALFVLMHAQGLSAHARLLRQYADYTCTMAVAVFFAGLVSAYLLEDGSCR